MQFILDDDRLLHARLIKELQDRFDNLQLSLVDSFVTDTDSRLSDSRRCDNSFDDPATARSALGVDLATDSRQCNNSFDDPATALTNIGGASNTDGRLTNSRTCNNLFDNAATAKTNLGIDKITQNTGNVTISDTLKIVTSTYQGSLQFNDENFAIYGRQDYTGLLTATNLNNLDFHSYSNFRWFGDGFIHPTSGQTGQRELMKLDYFGNLIIEKGLTMGEAPSFSAVQSNQGYIIIDNRHFKFRFDKNAYSQASGASCNMGADAFELRGGYGMTIRAPQSNSHDFTVNFRNNDGSFNAQTARCSCRGFSSTSDDRVKCRVTPIENGLEVCNLLEPVRYINMKYNADPDHEPPDEELDFSDAESGFIAQQILEKIPDLEFMVNKGQLSDGSECFSLNYDSLIAYTVGAIQELHVLVKTQAETIANLQERITALENPM